MISFSAFEEEKLRGMRGHRRGNMEGKRFTPSHMGPSAFLL